MCLMEYLIKAIIEVAKFTVMVCIATVAVCFVLIKMGLLR